MQNEQHSFENQKINVTSTFIEKKKKTFKWTYYFLSWTPGNCRRIPVFASKHEFTMFPVTFRN